MSKARIVFSGTPEEDDSLVEKSRVDVEGAFTTRRLLYDHRDQWAHQDLSLWLGRLGFLLFRVLRRLLRVAGLPDLPTGLGERRLDRLGVLGDHVDRLAHRDVLAEDRQAAVLLELSQCLAQLV